jgi:23S rRNA (uracil1939-C5)-methyltransferase
MGRRKKKFQKRTIEQIEMTGIADRGRAIGRTDEGMVVFVEDAVPGDVVDVELFKEKSGYAEGRAVQIRKFSEDRVSPFCEHFGICGGCKWQNLSYEAQVQQKELVVKNAMLRIGKTVIKQFLPIVPCEENRFYRNKLEFAFSNKRWLTKEEIKVGTNNYENVLGYHRAGAFDKIVPINYCYLQKDPSNDIRNTLLDIAIEQQLTFFDLKAGNGFLRHIMLRITMLDEIMLIVSFYHEDEAKRIAYLGEIKARLPQISSLQYCINPKENDFILDLDIHTYNGKSYIEEDLRDIRFRIGPKSFFQTNTKQAERLFDTVVGFAELDGTQNVYDLYTGIGSIALYIAKYCKQVVGIEEVASAIEDAKDNAARNGLNNTAFYAGDVKEVLSPAFAEKHGRPDLIITDPPRAGMHSDVIDFLLLLEAPRIVYVSCNPATQARDFKLLSGKYTVLKLQPVDMFPHTHHIETVALLELKAKKGVEEWQNWVEKQF